MDANHGQTGIDGVYKRYNPQKQKMEYAVGESKQPESRIRERLPVRERLRSRIPVGN